MIGWLEKEGGLNGDGGRLRRLGGGGVGGWDLEGR